MESVFDVWLARSDARVNAATSVSLDLDAMRRTIKRQAVASLRIQQHQDRLDADLGVRGAMTSAFGAVMGALALKPIAEPCRQAEILTFPATVAETPVELVRLAPEMSYRDVLRTELDGALRGEPRAVERLLASIEPLMIRYCRARLGRDGQSFAAADAVAQEACLAVLTALPRYPGLGRPFLAFVYETVVREVARAPRRPAEKGPGAAVPEQQVVVRALSAELARLLESLPDLHRDVLLLRVVVGLSEDETAEAVGMSPSAARIAQHRALMQLRRALAARSIKIW